VRFEVQSWSSLVVVYGSETERFQETSREV
jgi:hypothetical protein